MMSQLDPNTESKGSNDTMTEMKEHATAKQIKTMKDRMGSAKRLFAKIAEKGKAFGKRLKEWYARCVQLIKKGKAHVQEAWAKVFTQERKEKIKARWLAVTSAINKGLENVKSILCKVIQKIQMLWNKIWTPQRKEKLKKIWLAFANKCKQFGDRVAAIACQAGRKILQVWYRIFTEQRRAAMKAKGQLIINKLRPVYEKGKSFVLRIAQRIAVAWQKLTCEKNKQAVKRKIDAIKNFFVRIIRAMRNKIVQLVKDFKEKETEEGLYARKVFYISDYEKEAAYLRSMSLKGYHFVRNEGFRFEFVKGDPKNYFYLLDYYKIEPSEEEVKRWQSEGWEDIFHAPVNYEGSWHFFRRELGEGDMLEYNENNDSRLELFERLTKNWQGILSVIALCCVFSIVAICMQIALHGFPWMIAICIALATLCLIIFGIYLNMYYRTRLCIMDIQTRQQKDNVK